MPIRTIIRFIKNSNFLTWVYNYILKVLRKNSYYLEIDKRSRLSIFNYQELAKDLKYFPIDKHRDANFFGIMYSLKNFTGVETTVCTVEHGIIFGNHIPYTHKLQTVSTILTFSSTRVRFLKNHGLTNNIQSIGPYIHYANDLKTCDKKNLKDKLGKTLVFFPSHSIKNFEVEFDIDNTIDKLNQIKTKFNYDTVLVCMFYEDIQIGKQSKVYEENGFKIVTAGHRYDINFLNRLKTIINLSNVTISNSVGTHVGYSIYLGKPHYIFKSSRTFKFKDKIVHEPLRSTKEIETINLETEEIYNSFSDYNESISQKQRELINKYWGLDQIKDKNELLKILNNEK